MNSRFEIEEGIIACIVYAGGFATVSCILQKKNFKNEIFQKIFETATTLYPTKPIDPMTIRLALEPTVQDFQPIHLAMATANKNMVNIHLRYWCMMVLQMDITTAFEKELINWRDLRKADGEDVESAILTEMLEMIRTPNLDVLDFIDKAIKYFDIHNMTIEFEQTREFDNIIGIKTRGIQRGIALDQALSAAYKIAECDYEVKQTCDKFIGAINTMIITGNVKPEFLTASELL